MIKAEISRIIVGLDNGIWSADDIVLLDGIKNLIREFDLETHDYHPQPELQLAEWICEKAGGRIISADDSDPADPKVEY